VRENLDRLGLSATLLAADAATPLARAAAINPS
jgi:hypothetical protein